jgi:hypothetical protein
MNDLRSIGRFIDGIGRCSWVRGGKGLDFIDVEDSECILGVRSMAEDSVFEGDNKDIVGTTGLVG